MPYGILKVDTITFTDNSVDKSVSLSGLIQNPTFTGNVTATGTISGDVIRGGTTISGATLVATTIELGNASDTTLSRSAAGVLAVEGVVIPSISSTNTLTNKTLTSPTLTTPVLGTPTSGTLSSCTVDGTDVVGFRNIPQNSQSANYTLVLADNGKHIFHPVGDNNARTFTIPANSSVAYPIGTALTFINMAAAAVTIAITSDTLTLSSAGTTGSRTLAQYGSATCIKITSTSWLISGSGLT